jgi:soluble P-type ATPase
MSKAGIAVDIPGDGLRRIHTVVSDYSGTLSRGGKLTPGVRTRLLKLRNVVDIEVVSSDTFGTAAEQLRGIAVPHILTSAKHDREKQEYVRQFDLQRVAAFGNGNNDRLLLKAVREAGGLAIAVDNGEGCALDTLLDANLFITGVVNALDLLLAPRRLKATLRF